jgi:hypothetical protein
MSQENFKEAIMKKQQHLSYSRLVSRTDFYKEKALELEQTVVFTEEKVRELEKKLNWLSQENEKKSETVAKFAQLKEQYDELERQYADLQEKGSVEKIEALSAQLQNKEKELEEFNETVNELKKRQSEAGNKRIEQFESLLSDVQNELNEKEQQVETYKARVESLEKRLSARQTMPRTLSPTKAENDDDPSEKLKTMSYFDYSLIVEKEHEAVIRGHFHIANVGTGTLGTPLVCFRFYPVESAALKGKITSLEKAAQEGSQPSRNPQWVYWEDDWTRTAKERGEIWLRPYPDFSVRPGETLTLRDFQIPVKKRFDEKIIIEGFVYFQDSDIKEKALNQILITI